MFKTLKQQNSWKFSKQHENEREERVQEIHK